MIQPHLVRVARTVLHPQPWYYDSSQFLLLILQQPLKPCAQTALLVSDLYFATFDCGQSMPSLKGQGLPVSSSSTSGKMRKILDWTRNPPPENLTAHQKFIREVDWSASPLGPMDQWPDQLRQMVLAIVADPNPALINWGDSQAIVYNEAYIYLIGDKHPGLQGQDPRVGGFAELCRLF